MTDERTAIEWQDALAPSLADFERIAEAAWRDLPERFRKLCEGVAVRVEDFAPDEVLDELEIEDPFELMGVYSGRSLTQRSVMDAPQAPDMVVLFRRAIIDCWAEGEDTLGALVTHVLVHEVGHHFGLSDADMEAIEAESRRESG